MRTFPTTITTVLGPRPALEVEMTEVEQGINDDFHALLDEGHGMLAAWRILATRRPEVAHQSDEFASFVVTLPMTTLRTPECWGCGHDGLVSVTVAQLEAYRAGALVQVAFADLSTDEREQIISGYHSYCWTAIFG